MMPLVSGLDVRALLPTIRVPTLVVHHADDPVIPPEWGKYVADHISGAKYVELPGRNLCHFVEPWHQSFQEIASFFILLVVAGNETTRNAISHGVLAAWVSIGI